MSVVIIANRFEFDTEKDKLGSGAFSTAYKATDKHRNRQVVIKIFDKAAAGKFDIIREIQKVENIIHPNLIRYYDAFLWETNDYLGNKQQLQVGVLEYANGGTLKELMKKGIPLQTFESLMEDVMNGLDTLHRHRVLHLDLKPENIFIHYEEDGTPVAKIGDFGLSRVLQEGSGMMSTASMVAGTPEYIAPEVIFRKKYGINGSVTYNADLWSLGMVALKYFTGKSILQKSQTQSDLIEMYATELNKGIPLNLEGIPPYWQKFIRLCLLPHAEKRPKTIAELKKMCEKEKNTAIDPETTIVMNAGEIREEMSGTALTSTNKKVRKHFENFLPYLKDIKEAVFIKPGKTVKKILIAAAGITILLWVLKTTVFEPLKKKEALEKIQTSGYSFTRDSFFKSIENGEKELVASFLNAGMDPNAEYNVEYYNIRTALMHALANGHKEVAELLIQHGADVNAKNNYGETALMWAARHGHKEVAELLIQHGADVNAKDEDGWTALMYALANGHKEVAELLIQHGADVNAKNNYGETALMWAARHGHKEVAELLIQHGADVNAKNNYGGTALMYAAIKGHKEVAELLIQHGAHLDLISATCIGDKDAAESLIRNGADVNAKDEDGRTALMKAAELGHKEVAELLIQHGADVNAKDEDGETALMKAAFNGHKEVAELLIQHGADVNAKDEDGETALNWAKYWGYYDIVKLLKKYGAYR
ncbi:MAG: hypothetical protein KatS3mg028_1427 [Bacteroidia bacterium]|nr:MAG: hypothetical protein KatS3mg028_1427 [Bacteroidia bacterium]